MAQKYDETVKTKIPVIKMFFWPNISPNRPNINKKLTSTRRWRITIMDTKLVLISRYCDIVGSEIFTIPALNDHKNIARARVNIIKLLFDFKFKPILVSINEV